jgi:NAD(P)-dependent dehydrogenase (short-subunit alcohol dehydrogenase family)
VKALVTGGSAGIGLEIARQLLERGYDVVSVDTQAPGLKHPKLEHVELDLTNTLATERFAEKLRGQDITTVIHNAGVIRPALLPEVKLADLSALVNLHLSAAVLLVQAALPAMRRRSSAAWCWSPPAPCSACRRAPPTRRPRPACLAWRAPGRSSSRRTASPSTWWRRGR